MQLQNQPSTFVHKNESLLSATIYLVSPLAYNAAASSDELTCSDYVDFGKCHDILEQFS